MDHPLLGVRTPALRPHRDHHDEHAGLWRVDPADEHVGVLRPAREVGRHVQRRRLRDHAESLVLDADEAGDPPSAVGADDVLGCAPGTRAWPLSRIVARTPSSSCSSAISSWLKRMRPGESSSARAFISGSRRICGRLSCRQGLAARQNSSAPPAPQASSRRHPAPVVGVGSGKPGVERGRRHVLGGRAALRDGVGHADVVEHLHRTLVEHVRLRQVRRGRARADEQVLDALARQEHRRGQAGAAATHDQDRNVSSATWTCVSLLRGQLLERSYKTCFGVSTPILSLCCRHGDSRRVTPNRRGMKSRELVLDAAERVMAEHGFEAATLARVVEDSGVPMSSVYHYYGSKDGILLAVMERGAERFFADLPGPPTVRTARAAPGHRDLDGGADARAPSQLPPPADRLRRAAARAAAGGEIEVVGRVRRARARAAARQIAVAFGDDVGSPATDPARALRARRVRRRVRRLAGRPAESRSTGCSSRSRRRSSPAAARCSETQASSRALHLTPHSSHPSNTSLLWPRCIRGIASPCCAAG